MSMFAGSVCVCVCDRGVTVNTELRWGGMVQVVVVVVVMGGFDCRVKLQNIPCASDKAAKQSNFPQMGEEAVSCGNIRDPRRFCHPLLLPVGHPAEMSARFLQRW